MLDAGAGNLVVTDIASAGAITAAGALVNLGSSGAMNVAQAIASTGPLTLNAGGPLSLSGSASGGIIPIGASDIAIGGAAPVGSLGGRSPLGFHAVNLQQPIGGAVGRVRGGQDGEIAVV